MTCKNNANTKKELFVIFPSYHIRGQLWRHSVRCWIAITKGQDMPSQPEKEERFNKNLSFFEAISESIAQFTISDIIIRTYGVSDDLLTKVLQLFSLASSMLSLTVAFIMVSQNETVSRYLPS